VFRHWAFWRKGFWLRPALVLLYGSVAVVGGLAVLAGLPAQIGEARSMTRAAECGAAVTDGCLRRLPVRLDGPYYQRGPGSEWEARPVGGGEAFEPVDVSTAGSSRLEDLAGTGAVDALVWRGEVVAFETAAGERIEADGYGHRRWVLTVGIGLFVLSLGAIAVLTALVKRRASDGWWSTSAPPVGLLAPTPATLVVGVLFFVACALVLSAALGAAPGWALAVAIATAAGLTALVLWGLHRQRSRRR
jgi:hypothetical protein